RAQGRGSGSQSAAGSSRPTAAGSGWSSDRVGAPRFASAFRWTDPRPGRPPPRAARTEVNPTGGPSPVVLLIEDEPQMCRFLRATLRAHDYHVIEAATAREGLIQAAGRNPDLVLLDLGLPDADGLEVARAIRRAARTPIIVISARGQERDKVAALDL